MESKAKSIKIDGFVIVFMIYSVIHFIVIDKNKRCTCSFHLHSYQEDALVDGQLKLRDEEESKWKESKVKYFKIDGFVIVCMISSFIHSFISLSFIKNKRCFG
jgi:hypothetical protein